MGSEKKRIYYLDLLRIIACFLVVMNHTQGYMNCFDYEAGSSFFSVLGRLSVGMLIKMNVPLFFMISGTLLLNKELQLEDAFKRSFKFFAMLLGFSLVATIVYTGQLDITGFIRRFATAKVDGAGPYWYLYSYIGILLIAVFLRYITKNLTLRDVVYILVLRLIITGVIPMVFLFLNVALDTNIYLATEFNPAIIVVDCVFYPIIGFGLDRCLDVTRIKTRGVIGLLAAFFGAVFLEAFLTWLAGPDKVFSGLDFVMTCSFFLLVKYLMTVRPISDRAGKVISGIAVTTFGIYLLDPIVGNFLKAAVHSLCPSVIPSLLLTSVIYCIASMVVCGGLTMCWHKVVHFCKTKKAH